MEQEGQRTGSERCPGEADLPGPEFRGTLCPHLPSVQDRLSASTCAGAKRRRPASFLEKNPPIALPPPLPLKKRVKKKSHPPPHRGSCSLCLAGVRSRTPPGPARFRDPPVDAGSSPVPGAAESRTSVTWIFQSSGGRHSFLPREERSEPEKNSRRARCASLWARHALFSLPLRSLLFWETRGPSRRGFFFLVRGRGLQKKSRRGGCY